MQGDEPFNSGILSAANGSDFGFSMMFSLGEIAVLSECTTPSALFLSSYWALRKCLVCGR